MTLKLKTDDDKTGPVCPACGQSRPANSTNPIWQCPFCGVAYAKAQSTVEATTQPPQSIPKLGIYKNRPLVKDPYPYRTLGRIISVIFLLCLIGGFFTYGKQPLPTPNKIDPDLYQDPIQTPTDSPLFQFNYQNRDIEVQPVADYDLWGLIVSQNDIYNWLWGYRHDEVNFKDICVMWGDNLADQAYKNFHVWNKQWECFVEVAPESASFFHPTQFSNNHLLAADPSVRDKLWTLRVGDQIHLSGQLVNYHYLHEDSTPYWRRSSTRRTDMGNGACEVIFVKNVKILSEHSKLFVTLFWWSVVIGGMALFLRVWLFLNEVKFYKRQMMR